MTQWGLDTLFNPAKRHMDEEKRRLQATREEAGDSSGGKRIDLESGKVKIRRGGAKPAADAGQEAEATDAEPDAARDEGAEERPEADGNVAE
jgi:hypothetical protein